MAEKTERKTLSKQKLEIVKMEVDVPYSKGTKVLDRVHAKNFSLPEDDPLYDKPLRMTIFKADLKTYIRGKERIVADVEETPRPDSEYGPDRAIVQVYDENGNPVSRRRPQGGNQRTLEEELALESVRQMGPFLLNTAHEEKDPLPWHIPPTDFERLARKYWSLVEKGLDYAAGRGSVASTADTRQNAKSAAKKADKDDNNQEPSSGPIKHVGDLLSRASKLTPPIARDELCVALDVNDPSEIKDLDAAWKTVKEISENKAKVPPRQIDPLL